MRVYNIHSWLLWTFFRSVLASYMRCFPEAPERAFEPLVAPPVASHRSLQFDSAPATKVRSHTTRLHRIFCSRNGPDQKTSVAAGEKPPAGGRQVASECEAECQRGEGLTAQRGDVLRP